MARAAVIPQSPPKRAARGRSKGTGTRSAAGPAATTAAARAKAKTATTTTKTTTGLKKGTARTGATSKSDVDADEETDDDELGVIDNKAEPTTVRAKGKASATTTTKTTATTASGRGRKPAAKPVTPEPESDDDDELAQVDVPKKRVGRPRTKAQLQEDASSKQPDPAPKPRGRPKGSTNAKTTTAKTRTRTQTETEPSAETTNPKQVMINSAALRSNMLRGPAKKKTVTFQDMSGSEEEEEPAPAPAVGGRRATPATRRQTGLGAKPARKPAATTGRGRKPAAKEAPKPLSPKKANGVTKSISSYMSSDGEEDELSGAKDQVKFKVESPSKHGSQTTGLSSPVKRINLTPRHASKSVDENGKPVRRSIDFNDIISMSSPTREPSPSPFNYTLRETPRKVGFPAGEHTRPISQPDFAPSQTSPLKASPKKGHLETPRGGGFSLQGDVKPLAQPNFTPGQNSPLKASPKKGHLGTPKASSSMAPWDGTKPLSQPNFTPAQSSPLKTSPKKGNLGASFSQSAMQSSTPSFNPRISLFQSPAKRIASPFKTSMTPRNPPVTEQYESTTPKDEILHTAEPSTPEAESPLRPQALDQGMEEDENEDSADELAGEPDADIHVHHDTQSQPGDDYDEEMEGMAAVSETEHEVKVEEDNAPAHFREHVDFFIHNDDEQHIRVESTPDFHGIAETFAMNDVEDHFEARVHDHSEEGHEDHVEDETQNPASSHSAEDDEYHQDAEEPVEDVPQALTDDNEELAEEPASERQVEHIYDQLNTEVEAEMSEEEHAEVSDQEENAEPDIAQQETELSPQQHTPASQKLEDSSPEKSPAPESTHEDVEAGDNIEMEESEDELNYQPSAHEENEESDDFSDGDGFDGYDETTLVGVDITNQHYMDGVHHVSPRGHETERDPSPEDVEDIPPPIPSPPAVSDNHYRDETDDRMDSDEDESNTGFVPENQSNVPGIDRPETPDLSEPALNQRPQGQSIFDNAPSFTPLAQQFSQWKTSTPQGSQPRQPRRRGVFSIGGVVRRPSGRISVASGDVSYPDISRHSLSGRRKSALSEVVTQQDTEDEPVPAVEQEPEPEAEPETLEDVASNTEEPPKQPMPEIFTDPEPEVAEIDEHGENPHALHSIPSQDASPAPAASPSVHDDPDDEKENENISPLPAPAPVTPMKNKTDPLQTFHTVSKVPLKPEGDVSPLKMPRKRGRSLSDSSPTRSSPRLRRSLLALDEDNMPSFSPRKSPRVQKPAASPQRRASDHRARSVERRQSRLSSAPSKPPSSKKTPRKSIGGPAQLLQGAVVYVDVHTTEGEDASGIFIELLQQMGAKCFKTWSWNPRASVSPEDAADPRDKVGITHVVFKDGGVRTLEKVRQAGGVVKCVGVGWVLDCEREGRWVDETEYAVDSSIIPRGGAKRRKSMEPRALSNVNGTLVSSSSSSSSSSLAASRRRSGITPPVSRDEPQTPETNTRRYDASHGNDKAETYCQTPKTPGYRFNMDDYAGMSPATPFYLSRAKLVQQTCPPKQTREGLFPAPSRNGNDEQEQGGSHKLRLKLEAARRKSLAYKPRRGSPLVD